MTEPTIICPSCKSEIKLTESLAAPLIEATRRQYEQKFAQKETEITKRETAVKQQQDALEKAQESINEQVAVKLKSERASIASQEAKKAREALERENRGDHERSRPISTTGRIAALPDTRSGVRQRKLPLHCLP